MKLKVCLAVAVSLLFLSSGVSAQSINFDGNGYGTSASYVYDMDDGVTLTITATQDGSGSADVSLSDLEGHGVYSGGADIQTLDDAGPGDNEALIFTFSEPVVLSELRFRQWEVSDEVDFVYSGGTIMLDNPDTTGIVDYFNTSIFGPEGIELTSFSLDASDYGILTYFYVQGLDAVAVPLPGAFWLLIAGITGIVTLKKQGIAG